MKGVRELSGLDFSRVAKENLNLTQTGMVRLALDNGKKEGWTGWCWPGKLPNKAWEALTAKTKPRGAEVLEAAFHLGHSGLLGVRL